MIHRPELYCLFEQDDGAVRPLISKERFEAIVDGTLFILLMYFITKCLTAVFTFHE